MSDTADHRRTLEQDAALGEPLQRIAYEAGMMLGLDATRDEQSYHRRRLTRHQYWLHGYGTLAGMAVRVDPATSEDADSDVPTRIVVGAGLGIDGLGREVLVHEPYCIELGEWLRSQSSDRLRKGYSDSDDLLWLKITIRYADCQLEPQPVLARRLNLSTDPVQPSRIADSILLEMAPERPPTVESGYQPFGTHPAVGDELPEALTAAEVDTLDAASGTAAEQLRLHAQLLHALEDSGLTPAALSRDLEDGARLLLARLSLRVTDMDAIVVNPERMSVNNLVRPFLVTASQLAYLARRS